MSTFAVALLAERVDFGEGLAVGGNSSAIKFLSLHISCFSCLRPLQHHWRTSSYSLIWFGSIFF